jgi:hypothetical protein
MQHDSLMEKCVVLEEVDSLTSQLREQAAAARPLAASLASAANAYQERLRRVMRGMMATISELSLYQVCVCVRGGGARVGEQLQPWSACACVCPWGAGADRLSPWRLVCRSTDSCIRLLLRLGSSHVCAPEKHIHAQQGCGRQHIATPHTCNMWLVSATGAVRQLHT